jgi:hypothetical protein
LKESYVLDGGNFTFAIGGEIGEISEDPDLEFHFVSVLNEAVTDYVPSLGFNNSLQYSDDRIDTIIQNYSPPVEKDEVIHALMLDTWYRPMLIPSSYYNYFVHIFSIPQYTCD